MSSGQNTATKIIVSQENNQEESELSKAYKNLNEQCDIVLEKIKKRKIRQAKK